MEKDLSKFEERIGYKFKDKKLLNNALTHTSYAYESDTESNERLEYLGDSILEFISSEWLFRNYENLTEGQMTKVRASAVCEDSLFEVAVKLQFGKYLNLGRSELASNNIKKAILADSVEAVIAAIYLDSNLEEAKKFIINNLKDVIENASHHVGDKDYKSSLQEKLQVNGDVSIVYSIVKTTGPDHDKSFVVKLEVNRKVLAYGKGKSKKSAEMEAARIALEKLNNE